MQIDRETIIKLARDVGIPVGITAGNPSTVQIEHFAKRVAEHIRQTEFNPDWANYRQGALDGATEERQAIAQMVKPVDESLADEILARGK
jgi:hypothetical protein